MASQPEAKGQLSGEELRRLQLAAEARRLQWLSPDQAAAYLNVTRQTIYRWCEGGKLPFYELESRGGRRFKRQDLDKLLKPGVSDARKLIEDNEQLRRSRQRITPE